MSLQPNVVDNPQQKQIGPYRIDAEIGHSRTLIIYRAHDTLYDRPVLLKVLPAELAQNTELVRRFVSLGRDAARLHHPHLAEIYEAGHADGVNYIAQELLTGGTLAGRLQNRNHPYLLYDAIALIEPLAAALDYAHQQGYIHGALTADTVLFTADGQPKIADIGLSALDRLGTQVTFATNVSPYMAPEQARGDGAVDRHVDIYTLGVITFLLLTGQAPFVADNPLAMLRKIIDDRPPVDELLTGTIPTGVRQTLVHILAKSPSERHATATAFADALVHGEPRTVLAEAVAEPTAVEINVVDDAADDAAESAQIVGDELTATPWDETIIDVEAAQATWQAASEPEQPFIPFDEPAVDEAQADDIIDDEPAVARRGHRPFLPLSLLGGTALLLTLLTAGRIVWTNFGAQMVDAALTPYAAAQASRLTPPQPPTMLTVPGLADLRTTELNTPLFAGALVGTTDVLGSNSLVAGEQLLIQTMSSAVGADHQSGVAKLTGSPPMVVVAPSSTPTDSPTDTPFPTDTPVPTATIPPTETPLPTDTPTRPTDTPTALPSPTPLSTDTPTAEPSPTPSVTVTPIETLAQEPTEVPTETLADQGNLTGRIAYTRWDSRVDRYDLIFYSIAKGESWPIVPNRRQPDFAPNGQLIASGDGGFIDNLVLMGTNGENPIPVSAHAEDAHPHWSPSGKQLVFDSTLVGDGRHRLYRYTDETFGQSLTPMMFEAWELFGRYPIFVNNGQIVYNGCDVWKNASNCGIFRVDTIGSQPASVTTWPGDIPTDNLGGQILAMSDRSGNWDIYRVDAITGATQQLTDSPSRDGLATASPDGEYIAFVSDRGGTWAVYVMRADGSDERKLFELGGGFGSGERDWVQERISWGR